MWSSTCLLFWLISLEIYSSVFFFFNDTATTEISPLSLHDALPILRGPRGHPRLGGDIAHGGLVEAALAEEAERGVEDPLDRKSTRLNSSHLVISYAVFCLKNKIKTRKLCNDRSNSNNRATQSCRFS